jgi:hypothetical protein
MLGLVYLSVNKLTRRSQGDDADDFNPDRFIDGNGQLSPALADTKDGKGCFSMILTLISLTLLRIQKVSSHFDDFPSALTHCSGHSGYVSLFLASKTYLVAHHLMHRGLGQGS